MKGGGGGPEEEEEEEEDEDDKEKDKSGLKSLFGNLFKKTLSAVKKFGEKIKSKVNNLVNKFKDMKMSDLKRNNLNSKSKMVKLLRMKLNLKKPILR